VRSFHTFGANKKTIEMKKSLIFLFAFITIATLAAGQTSTGNMMVGGGLTYSSVSYADRSTENQSDVSFSPGFGYFINDNLAVGAAVSLSSSRDGTGPNRDVRTSFGLGPFARYYIFTANERFGFFGHGQLTFATGKSDVGGLVSGTNSLSIAVSPGAAFFFNEHWAVEFTIRGFVFRTSDPNTDNDNDTYNAVDVGLGLFSPSLGFRYHF
jgi:outer membrane protein W